jgi:hypothetical protein
VRPVDTPDAEFAAALKELEGAAPALIQGLFDEVQAQTASGQLDLYAPPNAIGMGFDTPSDLVALERPGAEH